jgi:(p)ppGpp synthase/HD superfamily hydrolase
MKDAAAIMASYEMRKAALRNFLAGRNYHNAVRAMTFAELYHKGLRKDGVTPEFMHQVIVTHHVLTLEAWLIHKEDTIVSAILHDVPEDYGVEFEDITRRFGPLVGQAVKRMTKKKNGVARSTEEYYDGMSEDPIASIGKGADRAHNFQSMIGVFSPEKQVAYIEEAETYLIPMMKKAMRRFPEQEMAYHNILHHLYGQIDLLRAVHAASQQQ